MKLGEREIIHTYTCGPYAGSRAPHWHGSFITKQPHGETSIGNGLCMTLPRALLWMVLGR